VHAIVKGTTRTPAEENPRLPVPISEACMRALSVAADDRFPTAAAFADELEDAARIAGIPVASSRAVSAFMSNLLPELERARPASSPSTPASRPEAGSSASGAGSAPSWRSARRATLEHSGPSLSGAPAASGSTHTEAVVSREARSTRRSRTLVLTGGALLGGIALALAAWFGLAGPKGDAPSAGAAAAGAAEASARPGADAANRSATSDAATTLEPPASASGVETSCLGAAVV